MKRANNMCTISYINTELPSFLYISIVVQRRGFRNTHPPPPTRLYLFHAYRCQPIAQEHLFDEGEQHPAKNKMFSLENANMQRRFKVQFP